MNKDQDQQEDTLCLSILTRSQFLPGLYKTILLAILLLPFKSKILYKIQISKYF